MNAQAMAETAAAPQAEESKVKEKKPRAPRKKAATPRKKKTTKVTEEVAEEVKEVKEEVKTEVEEVTEEVKTEVKETAEEVKTEVKETTEKVRTEAKKTEEKKPLVFTKPSAVIHNIVDLAQAPQRQIILNDQQILQLTLEEAEERHLYLEQTLARVLDYDVVLSDTNIWLELLVGHTSSHSDPRVNARLQFERQMEFISRMTRRRKGMFMMMAETYEEIDRFATSQEPSNYQEADFQDQTLCLNVAARLAKRLILSQQRENRLRIEGIGAESHHSAFADPAIIRRTVEFFAQGKKVLLITNDASVAIRSMGLCDDLQRFNNIDDETWERDYAPIRPMVFTFDDLKLLDQYTRQYHFIQQAAGKQWMEDIPTEREKHEVEHLKLWMEAFRPGDRHRTPQPQMPVQSQKKQQQQEQVQKGKQEQQRKQQEQQQKKQEQQKGKQEQVKQQRQKPAEQKPAEQKPIDQEVIEVQPDTKSEQKPETTEEQKPKTTEEQKPKPKRRSSRRSKKPAQSDAPAPQEAPANA